MLARSVSGILIDEAGQIHAQGVAASRRELVTRAITKMRLAGLRDYARVPADEQALALMVEVYAEALDVRGALEECILPAATRLCATGGDFPTAAEFATATIEAQVDVYRTVGIDIEDGSVAVVLLPRNLTVAQAEAFVAHEMTRRGIVPALPPPSRALREPTPQARALLGRILENDDQS